MSARVPDDVLGEGWSPGALSGARAHRAGFSGEGVLPGCDGAGGADVRLLPLSMLSLIFVANQGASIEL
jgi:hypothetical protein